MRKLRMLLPLAGLGVALAQMPGGGPRGPMGPGRMQGAQAPVVQFTELKSYLNLTDAQVQQIQQAQKQTATDLQAIFTQVQDKQKALRALLDGGTTDAAAVGKLMLEINALHKQIQQAATTRQTTALSFLTGDQKTKLKSLEDALKLQPAIHQAMALGLLTPPQGAQGPRGMGLFGEGPGMGGFGFGAGPMNFGRRGGMGFGRTPFAGQ